MNVILHPSTGNQNVKSPQISQSLVKNANSSTNAMQTGKISYLCRMESVCRWPVRQPYVARTTVITVQKIALTTIGTFKVHLFVMMRKRLVHRNLMVFHANIPAVFNERAFNLDIFENFSSHYIFTSFPRMSITQVKKMKKIQKIIMDPMWTDVAKRIVKALEILAIVALLVRILTG